MWKDEDLNTDAGIEETLDELSQVLGERPVPPALEAKVLAAIDEAAAQEGSSRDWSLAILPALCLAGVVLLANGPILTPAGVVGVPLLSGAYGLVLRWLIHLRVAPAR